MDYVRSAIELSEAYFRNGNYPKAADRAEKAQVKAAALGQKEWVAIAMNRRGKALVKLPRRKTANRTLGVSLFRQSSELSNNKELRLDNLEQLKKLAIMRNRQKDIALIESQIAKLKGESVTSTETNDQKSNLFGRRKKGLKAENIELNQQVIALEKEKDKLRRKQQNLQSLVSEKEAAIQTMSDEQMRQELILMNQERMLDSLAFVGMLDSLTLVQNEMVLKQQETELAEQEAQIQLKTSQRNLLIALAALGLLVAFGVFYRSQSIKSHNVVLEEKNTIIKEEKQRSEELLLNILPAAIADELKDKGAAKTRFYKQATVLFTDFRDFSQIAKKVPPEKLVGDLDFCFKNFDRIIEKFGLEKIKTIGDAYMCAGGLPKPKSGHPRDVVRAALEIQNFLMEWKLQKVESGEPFFEARVGIHTGPIIAGVVGFKKFAYDIWGDTVNVASRVESGGETGKVNISAATYELVKDKFDCKYRGKVPAKNVGEIEMYFVEKEVA